MGLHLWHLLTSTDPQGSPLGPVLPTVLMGSLGVGVELTISKFAHETQLGGALGCLKGQDALQRDPGRWTHWAIYDTWDEI